MKTVIGVAIVIAMTLSVSFSMARYQANVEKKSREFEGYIATIPESFGHWVRTSTEALPDYAAQELKVNNAESWIYTDSLTGEQVSVSVFVGPTGRLAVHTPEICITGAEIVQTSGRVAVEIPDKSEETRDVKNIFWKIRFNDRLNTSVQRLFYYAMGTGQRWYASENPRFEFANYPLMVKIQAEAMVPPFENIKEDVIFRFLEEFLPELDKIFAETEL